MNKFDVVEEAQGSDALRIPPPLLPTPGNEDETLVASLEKMR